MEIIPVAIMSFFIYLFIFNLLLTFSCSPEKSVDAGRGGKGREMVAVSRVRTSLINGCAGYNMSV